MRGTARNGSKGDRVRGAPSARRSAGRLRRPAGVLALLLAIPALAGDVQVLCPPGLRIVLDGTPVGTSSARDDGLFLRDVPPGRHTIRVEADGFVPQSYEVEVGEAPTEVRVAELVPLPPEPVATPRGEQPARFTTLVVTSAPQNCTVEIAGRREEKTAPTLRLDHLPPGRHRITFTKEGYASISGEIVLHPGTENAVRGDLIAGEVRAVHEGKGSLRLISNPQTCTVRIAGRTRDKVRSVLNVTHLPAGEHRLVVAFKGKQLATTVLIRNRQRTVVRVDLLNREAPFAISYEPE